MMVNSFMVEMVFSKHCLSLLSLLVKGVYKYSQIGDIATKQIFPDSSPLVLIKEHKKKKRRGSFLLNYFPARLAR